MESNQLESGVADLAVTWGQFNEDSLTFFTEPGWSLFMSLKGKALSDSVFIGITNKGVECKVGPFNISKGKH